MKLSKDYEEIAGIVARIGEANAWSAEEYVRDKVTIKSVLLKLYTDNLLGSQSYHIRCGVVGNKNTPLSLIEIAAVRDESPIVKEAARKALIQRFRVDMNIKN